MARAKQTVLTAADKKAVIADLNTGIKSAKYSIKHNFAFCAARVKEIKNAEIGITNATQRIADAKQLLATSKDALKTATGHTKNVTKLIHADEKTLAKLEKTLADIVNIATVKPAPAMRAARAPRAQIAPATPSGIRVPSVVSAQAAPQMSLGL